LRHTEAAEGEARQSRRAFGGIEGPSATPSTSSDGIRRFVVFVLDNLRYGLLLSAVDRAVRTVEVTPLPKAPEIVRGIINFAGIVVPVLDIRQRFKLPACHLHLSDHLIVARTSRRRIALHVDRVEGLAECTESEIVSAETVLRGLEYVRGVAKLDDGMVLIHDLDTFLSLEEEEDLGSALAGMGT
jgi:purine-binding chemotaxis protein CheW